MYSLPPLGKEALPLSHFPTAHQAFIFRAYEYLPAERIARVLGTDVQSVHRAAAEMGLPPCDPGDVWLKRGTVTIIRRMWHILPYEQLLELLEMDEQTLALLLRDEDFLDVKLAAKPRCEAVRFRELTEEERSQTAKIRQIVESLDFSGKQPFDFTYRVPKLLFEGKERFASRIIYPFSGLYQRAFDVDSESFLPDEQLEAYRDLGINGIWTQGILSQLAAFPFDPSVSAGYERRLERMREMTERLDKYGIKLYLYINEPRAMPLAFFEEHPELKGQVIGKSACLCTSSEAVQKYMKDAIEEICRAVPLLGGFFTITRSENVTNCYSHSANADRECSCPRCRERSVGEVIAELLGCMLEGARRVSPDIKIFAWTWRWDEHVEDIIRRLPKEIILLSQSEQDMPFEIGGVSGLVQDYSMSIVGPGDKARAEWRLARECGLSVGAKVQVNTTWEASTVPAIPVAPSIERHMQALGNEGVEHLLLSWTLGGYPCANLAAAAKYFYEKCTAEPQSEALVRAQEQFATAFAEFPFHLRVLYNGPQNAGPSTLLFEKPTGYKATMTGFAYDDLEKWRAIYPADVFEEQFRRLCEGWTRGLEMLADQPECEITQMAEACYCLFKSSLDQIRFIRARDEGRAADALAAARAELATAGRMLTLMNKNAAIGYEAANHYYFSKGQLAEKILNCYHVIKYFESI